VKIGLIVAAAVIASTAWLTPSWAVGPLPVKDAQVDWGVPWWESTPPPPPAGNKGPMVLELWEIDPANNTKLIKRTLKVDNLPKFTYPVAIPPFVPPPGPLLNETPFQYNARIQLAYQAYLAANKNGIAQNKAAWEAASKDKADKIAAAINGVLGAGRATSSQILNPNTGLMQGRTDITGVSKIQHGARSNTTGEVGDSARIKNGSPGGASPYPYKASMGSPSGFTVASATGVGPAGEASIIEFGIGEIYVSQWFPLAGDSLDQVLSYMEQDLDAHGLPATFDSSSHILSLDGDFTDDQTFVWSMSESAWDGELGASFGSTAPESVPEPASLMLLGLGAIALLKRSRN
jgi:hypothetical protein